MDSLMCVHTFLPNITLCPILIDKLQQKLPHVTFGIKMSSSGVMSGHKTSPFNSFRFSLTGARLKVMFLLYSCIFSPL
jgi:hypothetical protein